MADPVERPTDPSSGAHIRATGAVSVDGDIVGRDKITLNVTNSYQRDQAEPHPKFLVPFPRNEHFVGRDDDLATLHETLQHGEPVGIRPAMLTGLGGIGKTQLAVEYVCRFRDVYSGGVYWINAAEDWQSELAARSEEVGFRADGVPESDRRRRLVLALVDFLNSHPEALLIFDNVDDPRLLRTPAPGFVPAELKCHLLFTSRKRNPDWPFATIEVKVLPEQSALELLLHTKARKKLLVQLHAGSTNPELVAALSICRSLGYLPLALALAAAYLGKQPSISLTDFRERLERDGGLVTVDALGVDPLDLPTRHEAAVAATLKLQWNALESESAKHVLQMASLLKEATQIPRARLALFTGLSDIAKTGYPAPLDDALISLRDLSLVEELTANHIRLHPLIREFAFQTLLEPQSFAEACAERLVESLWNVARLHSEIAMRGIDGVLTDIRIGLSLNTTASRVETRPDRQYQVEDSTRASKRLYVLLRPLDLEAHHLRNWNPNREPSFFLQQFRNRCLELRIPELQTLAEAQLTEWKFSYLRERAKTSKESDALVRTLLGHTSMVNAVAITPDGRFVISASYDNSLKVWELESGQIVRTLAGHNSIVYCVAVTPDGHCAISGSHDATLRVWDVATGEIIRILEGHVNPIRSVSVTPDGQFALSLSKDDGILLMWDLVTGQVVRTERFDTQASWPVPAFIPNDGTLWDLALASRQAFQNPEEYRLAWCKTYPFSILGAALTPDGRYAITPYKGRNLIVWDLKRRTSVRTLEGHTGTVSSTAVTPDSRKVISASTDGTVKVWKLANGQLISTLVGHSSKVIGVAITPDGRFAISAAWDKSLKVWDLEDGSDIPPPPGHRKPIYLVTVSQDGQRAISSSKYELEITTMISDLATGKVIQSKVKSHDVTTAPLKVLEAVTPDGQTCVSLSKYGGTLTVSNPSVGKIIRTIKVQGTKGEAVAVTPDGRFAISTAHGRTLQVWDLGSGQLIHRLRGHNGTVHGVSVTRDGHFIVSVSRDRTLKVWDMTTGRAVLTLAAAAPLLCCTLAPDDRTIVVGDEAGAVHIVELILS